ncbi:MULTISPECIES: imidazole glycerol phosphate synthase subunit HisF [unclassified Fusibacter]|uniref:imidazole glycerol phosphate synthase subunit HisF n=1 Tax=unclassified Fusibacter TaxID=2624464 RepID=UPI0010108ED3|nr:MULTISPECIES: imidazole glycerol phosphate synthase subunit HisF [unclassified Fusibacter]MCK8058850.1 imidazole glycerol phosphate synthase subunit HisF [Fusibacter sp. A2]NPE21924.1 imidazole glycerol phosphate synthase subunit HisF [Fusibacter sp. A1]RXV61494.1 imidazole glycerol phosphate synthase subunit HisF [Fusibacter sp. A1]
MLKKRIIPCLDIKCGRVVKGVQFEAVKELGDPITMALHYTEQGADELVIYDIGAGLDERLITRSLVKEIADVVNIPLTVGGGVNSLEDVQQLFENGADKVSINSGALKNIQLIYDASQKYGKQSIVGSVDVKYVVEKSAYEIVAKGGKELTGIDALEWIERLVEAGIGELVVNIIDCDGTKKGYDIAFHKMLDERFALPVIASGGAGSLADFETVFMNTSATGALAASIFHKNELTINEVKTYLTKKGIPIRV